MKRLLFLGGMALLSVALVGCNGSGAEATKDQEEAFKNPPKEMPADVAAKMQKSREEGMRKAAEMRSKAGGAGAGGPGTPAGGTN